MSGYDDKDRLARELHERSRDVGGHPLDLGTVKRSARRIQWRRRAAAGLATAAVLAVAVPAGFALTGTSTRSVGPASHATASVTTSASPTPSHAPSPPPSETPTATATTAPGRAANLTVTAPQGPAPSLPYLSLAGSTTTVHHDGTTDVLQGRYSDVVAYRGGWLAYGPGAYGPVISRFNTAGAAMDQRPGTDFAVSDDGTEVAWVEEGTLHVGLPSGHSQGESTQKLPNGAQATAVGFVQRGAVYSLDGASPSVHVTDLNGRDTVVPGLLKSWGVSQSADLVGGETGYNPDGTSCWQVARSGGPVLWRTCAWALGAFSPDGRYVVGTPSNGDGLGSSKVALLEARTGKVVAVFTAPAGSFAREFRWEDGRSLLAVVYDEGRWTVLRLGVDGSVQRTLPPVISADTDPAYHLAWR